MLAKCGLAVIVALALGAGIAVAATQSTSSSTSVCVNDVNGLMRLSSTCRDGEHAVNLGGGGNATATQNGVFSVANGTTGGSKTLPLTGLVLSGSCQAIPPEGGGGTLARPLIEAASGQVMTGFSENTGVVGGQSMLLRPVAFDAPGPGNSMSSESAVVTSNGATATITFGGYVDHATGACNFLWQAVEVSN